MTLAQTLIFLLLMGIFICCQNNHSNTNHESAVVDTSSCIIVEYRDTSIAGKSNVTRLDFVCSNSILSSYDLTQNNPYRNMGFPIIERSTKHYKVGDNYQDLKKRGRLDFILEGSDFETLQKRIPHPIPDTLAEYDFEMAITSCGVEVINPKQAIVNYYISLYGFKNQRKQGGVIFLGGRLQLLNAVGTVELEIHAEDYAITYPKIDTQTNILTYRTTKMNGERGKDGFEIYDISADSLLFDFEFDTNSLVMNPVYHESYVLIHVVENYEYLKELVLYDTHTKAVAKKTDLGKGYLVDNTRIDNGEIILTKTVYDNSEDGEEYVYDTLSIQAMKASRQVDSN